MDARNDTSAALVLVARGAGHTCVLNLTQVIEIMRPLPVEPLANSPEIVLGLSVIRGTGVPGVSLAALFGASGDLFSRLVIIRVGDRRVALAVDDVLGIREFPRAALGAMPPLVQEAGAGALEAIGALDSELLFVLNSANVIPDELLASLAGEER